MKAPSSGPVAAGGDKRIASLEEENRQLKKGTWLLKDTSACEGYDCFVNSAQQGKDWTHKCGVSKPHASQNYSGYLHNVAWGDKNFLVLRDGMLSRVTLPALSLLTPINFILLGEEKHCESKQRNMNTMQGCSLEKYD